MRAEGRQQGSFFFNVNVVFASQVFIYGFAFLLRIVLARGLGDAELGTYSLFYLAVLIAGAVGNLGVGLGNIYFLNKGDYGYRELFSNSLLVMGTTAVITAIVVVIYGLVVDTQAFVSGRAYWLYMPTIPVVVAYLLLTSFLHGSSRFLALAAVAVSQGLAALLIATALFYAGALDVFGAILAFSGSFALANLLALVAIGGRHLGVRSVVWPQWRVLKEQVKYGAQGQVANLAQLFNYRLDQFLVAAFVTRAGVGHYAVATSVSESVWWISSAVAIVLLPRLTSLDKERAEAITPVICRNTLLISILAALGLVAVSPLVITWLFGGQFEPAVTPLMLLMPGVVAVSAARVLGSYMFSQGKVIYNTYTTFIALGVTLVLDLALIPVLGINGAALASSIAYAVSLLAALWFYRRLTGASIWGALVPRLSDGRYYVDLWRRLTAQHSLGKEATGNAQPPVIKDGTG